MPKNWFIKIEKNKSQIRENNGKDFLWVFEKVNKEVECYLIMKIDL